ncbi:MAG: Oligopeptide ABC transporter, periplasmic oligopeptide-binding protein OppA, partial [uncultured Sphingomonadaceae bacterium]
MKRRRARPLAALSALVAALTGCGQVDDRPMRVVVIGEAPRIVDPNVRILRPADAVLMGAAAQGLVRLDAGGQIVPGLAERWSVSDDGLSYIFRIADARWPDGSPVTARAVARQLRGAIARGSRNPLSTVLTGIEEIVATNDVIEIRLAAPRPNLLHHLARAEFGIVRRGAGAGPFRVAREGDHMILIRIVPDGEEEREERVLLRHARPALAVALFGAGEADFVLGGTWNDLPIARAADPPAAALRLDPAAGLFGVAVVDTGGPLARPEARRALSMAIDRDALIAMMDVPGL